MIASQSPTSQITSLLSQPASTSDKDIMGRDDFLRVLITQLRHQNPMEPMGQEEMIAQLTQFNILDEVRSLNSTLAQGMEQDRNNITLLLALQQALVNSQSVSLIGKQVGAYHDQVTVGDGEAPTFMFDAPAGTANVTVELLDASGRAARVESLGARNGLVEYRPGTDGLSEGTYSLRVEAVLNDGTTQALNPRLEGIVTAIRFREEGTVLEIEGQEVFLADVISILA